MSNRIRLCYRCEHRARFFEEEHGPRMECKSAGSVSSCYMYMPVCPVIQKRDKHDTRPISGSVVLNARAHGVSLLQHAVLHIFNDDTYVKYYIPSGDKE